MTKRKAIDCKLVRPSNSNPGYFKYEVTIQEADGSTHVQPAYGKGMQDAIERLVWNERVTKVAKASEEKGWDFPILFIVVLIGIVAPGVWSVLKDTPIFSIAGFALVAVIGTAFYWFNRWLSKR